MNTSVGIVGGRGLIAQAIWQSYANRPDTEVRVFSRQRPQDLPGHVVFSSFDLTEDEPLPQSLIDCDLVINAASCVRGDTSVIRQVNVDGVRRLTDGLSSTDIRLIQVSTAGVYGTISRSGGTEGDYTERPESPLSRSRAEGDCIAAAAGATLLRPLFVTGVGDTHFLLPLLGLHLQLGAWINEGAARLSVVTADFLAAAAKAFGDQALAGEPAELVHIVPEHPISVRDLLTPLLQRLGVDLNASIDLDDAADRLATRGVPRRKLEQFTHDYFVRSSFLTTAVGAISPAPYPVSPEAAEWYVDRLRGT